MYVVEPLVGAEGAGFGRLIVCFTMNRFYTHFFQGGGTCLHIPLGNVHLHLQLGDEGGQEKKYCWRLGIVIVVVAELVHLGVELQVDRGRQVADNGFVEGQGQSRVVE